MSTTPIKATLGTMFNQEIGRKSHESMAQEIKQSVGVKIPSAITSDVQSYV